MKFVHCFISVGLLIPALIPFKASEAVQNIASRSLEEENKKNRVHKHDTDTKVKPKKLFKPCSPKDEEVDDDESSDLLACLESDDDDAQISFFESKKDPGLIFVNSKKRISLESDVDDKEKLAGMSEDPLTAYKELISGNVDPPLKLIQAEERLQTKRRENGKREEREKKRLEHELDSIHPNEAKDSEGHNLIRQRDLAIGGCLTRCFNYYYAWFINNHCWPPDNSVCKCDHCHEYAYEKEFPSARSIYLKTATPYNTGTKNKLFQKNCFEIPSFYPWGSPREYCSWWEVGSAQACPQGYICWRKAWDFSAKGMRELATPDNDNEPFQVYVSAYWPLQSPPSAPADQVVCACIRCRHPDDAHLPDCK